MKKTSGFTMVEVVAVLVLIGIISAVTAALMPRIGESEFAERLLLKSNLRYARQRSMETTNDWSVVFGANSYSLQSDSSAGEQFPSIDSGTHSSEASFSASGDVTFSSPNGEFEDGPVTISFDHSTVTVYSTGAIE